MRLITSLIAILAIHGFAFPATIDVPDNFPAIQDAIGAAVNGDEIIVRPGIYQENIDFLNKAITVKSEHGPDVTTIHGMSHEFSVVAFKGGEGRDSVLDGFAITNSRSSGIVCISSSPTILYNHVFDCDDSNSGYYYRGGGGIHCQESGSKISRNIISSCYGIRGGGGGIYASDSEGLEISENYICDNEVTAGWSTGGGVYCSGGWFIISNNIISRNWSSWDGYYYTDGAGGGLSLSGGSSSGDLAVVSGNEISYNQSVQGGGVALGRDVTLSDNDIFGNFADVAGGGICYGSSSIILNNRICENSARYGGGLGNDLWKARSDSDLAVIEGNIISHNDAALGGGISSGMNGFAAVNNVIFKNKRHLQKHGQRGRWDLEF